PSCDLHEALELRCRMGRLRVSKPPRDGQTRVVRRCRRWWHAREPEMPTTVRKVCGLALVILVVAAASVAEAVTNVSCAPNGSATANCVVTGGTASGNYTITATFTGPANYASSFGTATLHINFFTTVTAPATTITTYDTAANDVMLHAGVTSPFGGTVGTGKV